MKDTTLDKLKAALDAIWSEVGNGYGTEYQQLVHELQKTVDEEAHVRSDESVRGPTADQCDEILGRQHYNA